MSLRNEITIIVLPYKKILHFCHKALSGVASEAWYPYEEDELFECVEKHLVTAGLARNVTRIEELRKFEVSVDYKVVFNELVESNGDNEFKHPFDISINTASGKHGISACF